MPLNDFFKKIQVLQEFDIVEETQSIIRNNSEILVILLQEQLEKGKDSKGGNVTVFGRDYYSDRTEWNKRYHGSGLGKVTEWITNYMSGNFYAMMRVESNGEVFSIKSDVDYFSDIIRRSGYVIMELGADALAEFSREIVVPQLRKRFNQKFNGV